MRTIDTAASVGAATDVASAGTAETPLGRIVAGFHDMIAGFRCAGTGRLVKAGVSMTHMHVMWLLQHHGVQALEETEAIKQDRLLAILGHLDRAQLDRLATALDDIRAAVVAEFGQDYLSGHDHHLISRSQGRD